MNNRAWMTVAVAAGVLIPLTGGVARAADGGVFTTPSPTPPTSFVASSSADTSAASPQIAKPAPEPSSTVSFAIGALVLAAVMARKRRAGSVAAR